MLNGNAGASQDWKPWPPDTAHWTVANRTVLCHGCFDLMHLGHIRHLQEARRLGERLIVSVTSDKHVRKGMDRPYFTAEQRKEALLALACVDEVIINDDANAVSVIDRVRPDIYVKGIDYTVADTGLDLERAAVEQHGGRVHITKTEKWSSTKLVNAQRYPEETLAYLQHAKAKGFRDKIHAAFDRADKLKLAFVGETILDEYRYVGALGKPSKEFILATVEVKPRDLFLGGVMAADLHGDWASRTVITNDGDPIRKTRFVDADFKRKLFECYSKTRLDLDSKKRERFRNSVEAVARDADAVVVLDFGHGLIGERDRDILQTSKFLAVNAQTNAGNAGFNLVTNYKAAHYVCVDAPEARLAVGMQYYYLDAVIPKLHRDLTGCRDLVVTNGCHGSHHYNGDHLGHVPAFAVGGVDTMGAGDAFLAVSAPLVAAGLEVQAAAFVGNIAGAIKVSILGHQRHVGRAELLQTVDALLA